VERREERAGLHEEGAARDLLDAARDAEPVELAEGERLEDEQVEGALEQVGGRQGRSSRIEVLYDDAGLRIERQYEHM